MVADKDIPLNDEDELVWAAYTQGVKPLWENRAPAFIPELQHEVVQAPLSVPKQKIMPFHSPAPRDLKNVKIEARLDLHGYNLNQAHGAVINFILNAAARRLRCILIITGKGMADATEWWQETGILRQQVPRWLHEEPVRSKISSQAQAKPEHGGAGALYVFLRKQKY